MGKEKDLRIGVIGAGGRGHLAWYATWAAENVRLVAGADKDPKAIKVVVRA